MSKDKDVNKATLQLSLRPFLRVVAASYYKLRNLLPVGFPGSKDYWEQRYRKGDNSGDGSYNELAEFKAEVVNNLVKENKIKSVIDFGVGDGNQLRYFNFPKYIGLDVSPTVLAKTIEMFKNDKTKSFYIYDSRAFVDNAGLFRAELGLSLDVIYHLVEDDVYYAYLQHLFRASTRYVVIYASNKNSRQYYHVRHRKFTDDVNRLFKDWELEGYIKNRYPKRSFADFYIYKKS